MASRIMIADTVLAQVDRVSPVSAAAHTALGPVEWAAACSEVEEVAAVVEGCRSSYPTRPVPAAVHTH